MGKAPTLSKMYLGLYSTIIASSLSTLNPMVIVLGSYVIAVHHKIVLGEEAYLRREFGQEYMDYSRRVRRYI
jgi:protein-S-isoprenylcysteine O-methyltransferase Ste14